MSDGPYGRHGFNSNAGGYGGGGASYGNAGNAGAQGGAYAAPSYGQSYGSSYSAPAPQDSAYGSQYGSYGGGATNDYQVRLGWTTVLLLHPNLLFLLWLDLPENSHSLETYV